MGIITLIFRDNVNVVDQATERAAQRAEALREEREKQALRDKLEARADAFERDIDLLGRGDGHTIEERRIRGDISDVDAMRLKEIRDSAIDKRVDK
ncbi:MAG: hypothetical protein E7388_04335 [Ruminococcaceae bacterium]|nr:hypothetical protein [Oscillospiraceae bacterium]